MKQWIFIGGKLKNMHKDKVRRLKLARTDRQPNEYQTRLCAQPQCLSILQNRGALW
jgi:hypothetical protein